MVILCNKFKILLDRLVIVTIIIFIVDTMYGIYGADNVKKINDFNDFKRAVFYIYEELIYIDTLYLLYVAFDQQPELLHTDLFDANKQCCVDSYILSIYKLFDSNSSLNIFLIIEYILKDLNALDDEFLSLIDWYDQDKKYFYKQHNEYYSVIKKIKIFRNKVIAHADIQLIKSLKFEYTKFVEYWQLINLAKDIINITSKKYNIELDINRLEKHITYNKELNF